MHLVFSKKTVTSRHSLGGTYILANITSIQAIQPIFSVQGEYFCTVAISFQKFPIQNQYRYIIGTVSNEYNFEFQYNLYWFVTWRLVLFIGGGLLSELYYLLMQQGIHFHEQNKILKFMCIIQSRKYHYFSLDKWDNLPLNWIKYQ